MIKIDKTFNGKKIEAEINDVIEVQLAENPTTGYLWKIISCDENHLEYNEDEYETSNEAIGAGGIKYFYFKVIDNGTSKLNLGLGHPWENETIETFSVIIESK